MKFFEGKPLLIGGIALITLFLGSAIFWLLSTGDEELFRELTPKEIDNVSTELSAVNIAHSIDRGQGIIRVAKPDLTRAKQLVMGSGNAFREVTGFEIFNESDFGITDFAQKVNYQRALEGELSRTISSLDSIQSARVHLVLPEEKLFSEEKERVSASITIYVDPGRDISAAQVQGIRQLVAAAVPNIQPADITIVNQAGELLGAAGASDVSGINGRLHEKMRVEKYLLEKLRLVLDGSLGATNYVAHVDVSLDMNKRRVQTERLLPPDSNSGISRIRESESHGSGEETGKRTQSKEVSYEYGREVMSTEFNGYEISSMSVGVVIDSSVDGADEVAIKGLVSSVLGMSDNRGDRVTVIRNNIALKKAIEKFEQAAVVQEKPAEVSQVSSQYLRLLLVMIIIAGVLTFLFIGRTVTARLRYRKVSRQLQQWVDAESRVVS